MIRKDFKESKGYLIITTISSDKNISGKEFDKLSKYKGLEKETAIIWHLNTTIIPVVRGAPGMIKKDIDAHMKKMQKIYLHLNYKRWSQ